MTALQNDFFYTAVQKFGVGMFFYVFERSSNKAAFIDQKYSKNTNTVKYYYI